MSACAHVFVCLVKKELDRRVQRECCAKLQFIPLEFLISTLSLNVHVQEFVDEMNLVDTKSNRKEIKDRAISREGCTEGRG